MWKKNLPLIIGIAIPVAMVLFIAGSIYLSSNAVHPQYDFLYTTRGYDNAYVIKNGQLTEWNAATSSDKNAYAPPPPYPYNAAKLYVYDVRQDKSVPVSFEKARTFTLYAEAMSPDGYIVSRGSSGGGGVFSLFYDGGDYNTWYIKSPKGAKKLDIQADGSYYYDIQFLGWISQPMAQ